MNKCVVTHTCTDTQRTSQLHENIIFEQVMENKGLFEQNHFIKMGCGQQNTYTIHSSA